MPERERRLEGDHAVERGFGFRQVPQLSIHNPDIKARSAPSMSGATGLSIVERQVKLVNPDDARTCRRCRGTGDPTETRACAPATRPGIGVRLSTRDAEAASRLTALGRRAPDATRFEVALGGKGFMPAIISASTVSTGAVSGSATPGRPVAWA